jgi:arsenic resistance protein ArsH
MDEDVCHSEPGTYSIVGLLMGRERAKGDKADKDYQSSLPLAWKSFTPAGRLKPSSNRDRLVDVCEELVKFSAIVLPHFDLFNDRFSERQEKQVKGRLLTQAEKEKEKETNEQPDRDIGSSTASVSS